MSPEHRTFYLGTSGWAHRDWIGQLYPHDMPPSAYLTTYANQFNAVEIEHTFFQTPTKEMVQSWYRRTPEGFRFSPCAPRQITQVQRLHHTQGVLDDFLELVGELGEKLGPILFQLPADFRRAEHTHLEAFLRTLPHERQFAIEFRHGSWLKESTFQLLEAYHVAWVVVEASFLPCLPRVTAPFAYVRWHGHRGVEQQSKRRLDPITALRPWAPILRQLERQATCVYGYVRNSFSGHAPRDCRALQALMGDTREGRGKTAG